MAGEYWRNDKCRPGGVGGGIAPESYADATGRSRVPAGTTYEEHAASLEPRRTEEGDDIPRLVDVGVRHELIRQIDARINRCGDYVAFAASSTKLDLYKVAQNDASLLKMILDTSLALVVPGLGSYVAKLATPSAFKTGAAVWDAARRSSNNAPALVASLAMFGKHTALRRLRASTSSEDEVVESFVDDWSTSAMALSDSLAARSDTELVHLHAHYTQMVEAGSGVYIDLIRRMSSNAAAIGLLGDQSTIYDGGEWGPGRLIKTAHVLGRLGERLFFVKMKSIESTVKPENGYVAYDVLEEVEPAMYKRALLAARGNVVELGSTAPNASARAGGRAMPNVGNVGGLSSL